MGIEGFSHGTNLKDMNAITGNKNEFIWLFGILLILPFLASGRKSNEDSISSQIKTTNKYSKLALDGESSQFSKWTL